MAGILCLNGFLGMGITMTNESLEQRIAKQEERLKQQEERLKQLKAQKQAQEPSKILRLVSFFRSCSASTVQRIDVK